MNPIVWLFIFCGALTGCQSVKVADVIGVFESNFRDEGGQLERIDIHKDGTYEQTYHNKDGMVVSWRDSWTFETLQAEPSLTLHNFKFRGRRETKDPSVWGVAPQRMTFSRRIRLWVDEDLNHYYFRRKH